MSDIERILQRAEFQRGNAMLQASRNARLGEWGRVQSAKIDAQRQQITKLEQTPISSMKQAKALEQAVSEANQTLANLEHEMAHPYMDEVNLFNSQLAKAEADKWRSIQNSFSADEDASDATVNAAFESLKFDGTMGLVPEHARKRALQRLIAGDGESDANGRYVSFQFGSSAVYRAYVNADGNYGIVREGWGADRSGIGGVQGGE